MRFNNFTEKEIAVLQIALSNLAIDAEKAKIEDATAHTLCLEIEEEMLVRISVESELAMRKEG